MPADLPERFTLEVDYELTDEPVLQNCSFGDGFYATVRVRVWTGGAIVEENFACGDHDWELYDQMYADGTHAGYPVLVAA
jgi:hypothetical protein